MKQALLLLGMLILSSCNPPQYDYCEDIDIFERGQFVRTETRCYY